MSLSIAGIGAIEPIYAPAGNPAPYAQNQHATQSVAGTTAGAESGAVAVVYEPGASDSSQDLTYSSAHRDRSDRAPAPAVVTPPADNLHSAAFVGDESVVEATDGAVAPPPKLPETPHASEVKKWFSDVWAPVGPASADPAVSNPAQSVAPVQQGQAEASAQASYAAVVDASIAGAPISELEKFA